MEQLKSLISVIEALSKDNDLKKYVIIGHENDGSTLLKVRFNKRNPNMEIDHTKPVCFKRKSDKQARRDYDRKNKHTQTLSESNITTRSKAKNRIEIEQPRLDISVQSETGPIPISPDMPANNSVSVCSSNSFMCDSTSPTVCNQRITQEKPTEKIYAPTNFRNVIPINSLFDTDPSDHECDQKDLDDNTIPCRGCKRIKFPRTYCPDQRLYSCSACQMLVFKNHDAGCYKHHEIIFKSFVDSVT